MFPLHHEHTDIPLSWPTEIFFSSLICHKKQEMYLAEMIKFIYEAKEYDNMNICIRKKHDNCLNLFKLIAALQVMYGHMIRHLGLTSNIWFDKLFGVFQGVPIFFTLSGFLIWFSIERAVTQGGYTTYVKKRFWRIYPEMWIAISIEIIIMCILYQEWNIKDITLFTLAQSTIFQFWTPNSLNGYGCGTPNGSLWTMSVTIQFYIIAWFIYKLLKNKKWYVWMITIIASIFLSQLGNIVLELLQAEILLKLFNLTIIRYLWIFLLGMGVACFFDKLLPFSQKLWPAFACIGLIVSFTGFDFSAGYGILKTIFILLAIIGFSYQFPQLKLKNDISFGIFIYHMTVVNVMITFGLTGKFTDLLIAATISCFLGYISAITVGKYFTSKK